MGHLSKGLREVARCGKGGWPVEPSTGRIYILDGSGVILIYALSTHPVGKKICCVTFGFTTEDLTIKIIVTNEPHFEKNQPVHGKSDTAPRCFTEKEMASSLLLKSTGVH